MIARRHPPHHLSPAQVGHPAGQETPKRASAAPSLHSNAPIKPESQSILSKKIAHLLSLFRPNACHGVTIFRQRQGCDGLMNFAAFHDFEHALHRLQSSNASYFARVFDVINSARIALLRQRDGLDREWARILLLVVTDDVG
jgi:hypothetical protein